MKECLVCKKEFDGIFSDVCSWQCDEKLSTLNLRRTKSYSRQVLKRQKPPSHVLLLYEDEQKRDDMIIEFIQDGLRRGHLCVYASVNPDTRFFSRLENKISNFYNYISKGNLILTDLRSFQNSILENDLSLFEEFQSYLANKIRFNKEKFIRISGDLVDYLLKFEYYEQGILLEKHWNKTQFYGTNLCTCCNALSDITESSHTKKQIFDSHDMIINC